MSDATLIAESRAERGSRPAGRLRREGRVPAVVYGLGETNLTVTVSSRELDNILQSESGVNSVITLEVDGGQHMTLARQIQRHPVRNDLLHVDFVRVDPDVRVAAEVPVNLEGEPEGVKSGGVLEQLVFTLSIEAKPSDIPNSLEADVSSLEIGDQIRVGEISLPPGVVAMQDAEELLAQVIAPRVEVEEEPEVAEGELPEGVEPAAETEGEAESGGDEAADAGGD